MFLYFNNSQQESETHNTIIALRSRLSSKTTTFSVQVPASSLISYMMTCPGFISGPRDALCGGAYAGQEHRVTCGSPQPQAFSRARWPRARITLIAWAS